MSIKRRKKSLETITKQAADKALLVKVAQEVEAISSSSDEYARNFLAKLLEQTDIHIIGEDDNIT